MRGLRILRAPCATLSIIITTSPHQYRHLRCGFVRGDIFVGCIDILPVAEISAQVRRLAIVVKQKKHTNQFTPLNPKTQCKGARSDRSAFLLHNSRAHIHRHACLDTRTHDVEHNMSARSDASHWWRACGQRSNEPERSSANARLFRRRSQSTSVIRRALVCVCVRESERALVVCMCVCVCTRCACVRAGGGGGGSDKCACVCMCVRARVLCACVRRRNQSRATHPSGTRLCWYQRTEGTGSVRDPMGLCPGWRGEDIVMGSNWDDGFRSGGHYLL